jgi:hypothetical protein
MVLNLVESQHQLIHNIILGRSLSQADMADVAGCSERTIRNIAHNALLFGKTGAPANGSRRRRRITPVMLDVLCEHLLEKTGLYRDEMAIFLTMSSTSSWLPPLLVELYRP